jgi:hypothetical protein
MCTPQWFTGVRCILVMLRMLNDHAVQYKGPLWMIGKSKCDHSNTMLDGMYDTCELAQEARPLLKEDREKEGCRDAWSAYLDDMRIALERAEGDEAICADAGQCAPRLQPAGPLLHAM